MVANTFLFLNASIQFKFHKEKAKNERAKILEATKLKIQWKVVTRYKQENKAWVTFTMQ